MFSFFSQNPSKIDELNAREQKTLETCENAVSNKQKSTCHVYAELTAMFAKTDVLPAEKEKLKQAQKTLKTAKADKLYDAYQAQTKACNNITKAYETIATMRREQVKAGSGAGLFLSEREVNWMRRNKYFGERDLFHQQLDVCATLKK